MAPPSHEAFGAFWRRLAAISVDLLLIYFIPGWLLDRFFTGTAGRAAVFAFLMLGMALYFGFLESSPYQATVGKRLLGLRVVDGDGARLTFKRALGEDTSRASSP